MITLSRAAVAAAMACSAGTTFAAPTIVTDWSYSVSTEFTAAAPGAVMVSPSMLSWGTGASPSSLVISDSPRVGNVSTYVGGGAVPVGFATPSNTLTHNNNPIGGTSLTGATLRSTLTLDSTMPAGAVPGAPGLLPPLSFDIAFAETPNAGTCAVVTSPSPCNDIFVLTSGLLNASFNYDVDGSGLQTYFVNLFPLAGGALGLLPAGVCAAAGQAANCLGFTTPEGESTSLQFGFSISTERLAVPEPGTAALSLLALLGAGAVRRRARRG